MEYLLALVIAFGFSFVGLLPPGMLNMTALSISLKKDFSEGMKFGVGAAFIMFFQSLLVVKYSNKAAEFLSEYEMYVNYVAVAVLLSLAFSFLFAKTNSESVNVSAKLDKKEKNMILKGMTLAFANVLVYPYWLAQGIYWSLPKNGFINENPVLDGSWPISIVFSFGIFLGSVGIYILYLSLGDKILKKFDSITKNMNKILAALFFVLASLQILKIVL